MSMRNPITSLHSRRFSCLAQVARFGERTQNVRQSLSLMRGFRLSLVVASACRSAERPSGGEPSGTGSTGQDTISGTHGRGTQAAESSASTGVGGAGGSASGGTSANGTERSLILGDVERLSNGNTLITYSDTGVIQEVTPTKELVQTLSGPISLGYSSFRKTLYGPPQ